ncbi:putative RNA methyltransferase [Enterococcus songbeiensis]|uniref:putative RNA methyltransferase n=1 Tax=Enterococcus songbeiensis TaxID=2559927 RepID=UPI0010FA1924|nr:methyltransferase domain-containing protein [Enterococcus songbeiensis]
MLKKIDRGKQFIQNHSALFRCPLCQTAVQPNQTGMMCENQHRFDVSKKGTLFFLTHQIKSDYDAPMFQARQRMIKSGMYQPMLEEIQHQLQGETLLDVGCGEGSFLNALLALQPRTAIGFDIVKEGIYLATEQPNSAFWCVADLTNLPFADQSFSTVLNIFSPSNYQEFQRIMKADGRLIKIVPRANYLRELRQAFYPDDVRKQNYSNEKVVAKFQQIFPESQQKQITYTFEIPEARQADILEMSPLEWGVSPEVKEQLLRNPLNKITIDVDLLIGTNS